MADDARYPKEVTEHFKFLDKIGEGGFAKVRSAKHKISGEKVAIKIMEKAALMKTNDLPRVKTEINALKKLHHQNISQLYFLHENDTHFYLVLEYAPGGELFDYIVARQRCKEDEARRFFRQIVAAVAYCHEQGIAHRDLKPENLLLDKQMNIKLIDFGLIAMPERLGADLLSTCCGSAAYAAPELIRGEKYLGEAADMWSLGILLYALLVGWLPFDDDNMQVLYRMIQKGSYEIPPFLSQGSTKIIGQLLKHKPAHRLTMAKLQVHPWLLQGTKLTKIEHASTLTARETLDRHVVHELAKFYGTDVPSMEQWVTQWNYDALSANYHLLAQKRRMGGTVKLPANKASVPADVAVTFMRARPEFGSSNNLVDHTEKPSDNFVADSIINKRRRPKTSMGNEDKLPPINRPVSPGIKQMSASVGADPNSDLTTIGLDQVDAIKKGGATVRGRKKKSTHLAVVDKNAIEYRSHQMLNVDPDETAPAKKKGGIRTLLGSVASMFKSQDAGPRKIKGLFNVSTTSTKSPADVLAEIHRVLSEHTTASGTKYETKTKGFLVKARKKADDGSKALSFSLEVCVTANLDLTGIRLSRVKGDTWEYKKETEAILKQLKM